MIIICTPKLVVGPWELSSSLTVPPVQRRIARMRGHAGGWQGVARRRDGILARHGRTVIRNRRNVTELKTVLVSARRESVRYHVSSIP